MRIVGGEKVNLGVHQCGNEVKIAAEAVKFGDQKRCTALFAFTNGLRENGTVGPFAGFNFDELLDDFRPTLEGLNEVDHRRPLSLQPQA